MLHYQYTVVNCPWLWWPITLNVDWKRSEEVLQWSRGLGTFLANADSSCTLETDFGKLNTPKVIKNRVLLKRWVGLQRTKSYPNHSENPFRMAQKSSEERHQLAHYDPEEKTSKKQQEKLHYTMEKCQGRFAIMIPKLKMCNLDCKVWPRTAFWTRPLFEEQLKNIMANRSVG